MRENAEIEAALGEDALRASRVLLDRGFPHDAVCRACHAAQRFARAVLVLDGLQPSTDRVVATLREPATLRLPPDAIAMLEHLEFVRRAVDESQVRFRPDTAAEEVATAERFAAAARAVLAAAGA